MTSERTLPRIAGSLYLVVAVGYLVVAVGGVLAELVVRSSVVEPGNAVATADTIRASATLFRAGFVADLIGYVVDLFVQFLAPGIADTIELFVVAPAAVGELWLVAWLLVKGVPVPAPAPRAQALTG
jgi:hypothetical protein